MPSSSLCGFWIMLGAGKIVADEMSKKILVQKKFMISLGKWDKHEK